MKSLERENGGRERVCREDEEEVTERKGHHGQKPRPRAVAAHRGPWHSPQANRGVCWSKIFLSFFLGWQPMAVFLGVLIVVSTFYSFFFHVFVFSPFFPSNYKLQKY